jgi:hypothetical protein
MMRCSPLLAVNSRISKFSDFRIASVLPEEVADVRDCGEGLRLKQEVL